MDIRTTNKATIQANLRKAIMTLCDEDIQAVFGEHYFMQEPLLCQLLKEVRTIRMLLESQKESA